MVGAAIAVGGSAALAQPDEDDGPAAPAARETASSMIVDRVDAIVNDAVVLHSEVAMRVAPLSAELAQITDERERARRQKKLSSQVLEEMINEELMIQAAVEAKLEVKQSEIQSALEEIKTQHKLDDDGLAKALAQQGHTAASYKKDLRRQLLRMRVVNTLVRPKVSVTDEDLRARYDEMTRRSGAVSKVRLHHVLLALPPSPTEVQLAEAKRRAAAVIDRARAGEDFAKLAAQHSDDSATKDVGGDLGLIERGTIATEWETIVFAMEPHEVRGPINGPRGLHVFYVSEVHKTDLESFDSMKEKLRNELYQREMEKQNRLWLDDLRNKAHIVRIAS